jgi:hypothetical protein
MKMPGALLTFLVASGTYLAAADANVVTHATREQVFKMLQKEILSPAESSSKSMTSLAEVAGALSSLALKADDDATVSAIRTLVEALLDSLMDQHNTTQAALDALAAFDACVLPAPLPNTTTAAPESTTAAPTTSGAASTTGAGSTAAPATTTVAATTSEITVTLSPIFTNPNYTSCKALEDELKEQNRTCHEELAAKKASKNAQCEVYAGLFYANAGEAKQGRCDENTHNAFVGTYVEYLRRDITRLANLESAEANCTDATEEEQAKQTQCQAIHDDLVNKIEECLQYELARPSPAPSPPGTSPTPSPPSPAGPSPTPSPPSPAGGDSATTTVAPGGPVSEETQANCGPYNARVVNCTTYNTCHDTAVSTSDSHFTTEQSLEASRKAEYRALKRVDCLLDVLSAPAAEQTDKLTECVALTHDTSALILVKAAYPDKETCETGVKPAGCA